MSVGEPYVWHASFESAALLTVSALPARPDSVGDCASAKFVVLIETPVPLVRYASPPLTVRSPPAGAFVSACAVIVVGALVAPALFVAVTSPLCVVDDASNV